MKQKFTDNYGDNVEVYNFDDTVYLEVNSDSEIEIKLELSQSVAVHLAEAILKAARKASKSA